MIHCHEISITKEIKWNNPLHVTRFFNTTGMRWATRKKCQAMILSIANAWYYSTRKCREAPGFIEDELLLTSITTRFRDARRILEVFFKINRIGFNYGGENKGPTLVSPRKLPEHLVQAIESILDSSEFDPGPEPDQSDLVVSRVNIISSNIVTAIDMARMNNRDDLIPAIKWLGKKPHVNFYFSPSGKLRARDTSVWPIRCFENWPSWLRRTLLGTVIDIENAYCQFLVSHMYDKYVDNPTLMKLKYPDLMRLHENKTQFRKDLCEQLKLDPTDDNISKVKKLIMALANGSNITAALLCSGNSRSEAVRIVHESNPHLDIMQLTVLGDSLSFLVRQFRSAKKDICIHVLKQKPSAKNVKKVFQLYFEWERKQRYAIWDTVGRVGVMLHDGIDGIRFDEHLPEKIYKSTGIHVSIE